MNTGLALWIVFFAVWLLALYRATNRAFTIETVRIPGIPFQSGPIFAPTIVFHMGLSTILCVTLIASVNRDLPMLWFGLPGAAAVIIQGVVLFFDRGAKRNNQVKRLSPYWISEQWPFVLLGLSIGIAGGAWWGLSGNPFPILLVGFSVFFLLTFWFYFANYNEIRISHTRFEYVRSFPGFRTFIDQRPRTQTLTMQLSRRRRGIYDVHVAESGHPDIDLTASISPRERLKLEYESYMIRTDQY